VSLALLPNLGGEEGPGWRAFGDAPTVRTVATLWSLLFAPGAELLHHEPSRPAWPEGLGPAPDGAAFAWLEACEGVVPWIPTQDAAKDRRVAGRALFGCSPELVLAVHDKGFAHAVAEKERLLPPPLRGLIEVFDPEELREADSAIARMEGVLREWPEWARRAFVLKPRIGTSGRGRIAGTDGRADTPSLRGALPRLAGRGGALLEPWLERISDLSVQLHIDRSAGVTVLASLEQELTTAGRIVGHRGEIDSRGRIFSGHAVEEELRESAAQVAVAAAARGFFGPCGVDAFVFRGPDGEAVLRPVVELNARFTTGTVTAGLIRRALGRVKRELGLSPGERLAFRFRLDDDPEDPDGLEAAALRLADQALLIPLSTDTAAAARPRLLFSRTGRMPPAAISSSGKAEQK
jgi:hypothetical protein